MENDIEEEDITAEGEVGFADDGKNKRKNGLGKRPSSGRDTSPPRCQADKCGLDLSDAKRYHRRHKVCEVHAKAPVVILAGLRQRFCQQCSRFHELMEFDETKRSCRRRLAGHNERRRKSSGELYGGEAGPSCKAVVDPRLKTTKEVVAGQWRELADHHHERGSSGGGGGGVHNNHMMMSQGNPSNYKHFHIR